MSQDVADQVDAPATNNVPHPIRVARIVADYLAAVRGQDGKRGPSRDRIERRLNAARAELTEGGFDGLKELLLRQEVRNLEAQWNQTDDLRVTQLEAAFVAVAADYGERHGIQWATWREVGVHPTVLRAAGIKP